MTDDNALSAFGILQWRQSTCPGDTPLGSQGESPTQVTSNCDFECGESPQSPHSDEAESVQPTEPRRGGIDVEGLQERQRSPWRNDSPKRTRGELHLHPRLVKIRNEVAKGEIGFARGVSEANRYLDQLTGISLLDRDRIYIEFDRSISPFREYPDDRSLDGRRSTSTLDVNGAADGKFEGRLCFEQRKFGLVVPGPKGLRDVPAKIPEGVRGNARIREDAMPWYEDPSTLTGSRALTGSMQRTRNILSYVRRDVTETLHLLISALDAPLNFPVSEWKNILKGMPIDLDRVHEVSRGIHPPDEEIGKVGGIEFAITRPPVAKIETANEWRDAWKKAAQATCYVFPHRRDELNEYTELINETFETRDVRGHGRVFIYDKAIRNSVRGGESRSLTDIRVTQRFFNSIFIPGGKDYEAYESSRTHNASFYDNY